MSIAPKPETAVVFINARDMPQDEPGAPRYSALVDALKEPLDGVTPERERKLRTAAMIAIKTLRHENEDLRKDVADAIGEIKQLRLDVERARNDTKGKAAGAIKTAVQRIEALEAELYAWKHEPLVSRIWRAWRGI